MWLLRLLTLYAHSLIGPANFFDLHPTLDFHLTPSVTLTTDWAFFWRQSTRDGIYGPAVNLIRSEQASRARSIIDAAGKALLTLIVEHGAELVAVGCMTKAIVEDIMRGRLQPTDAGITKKS